MMDISIAVGALAPDVNEQLDELGFMVDGAENYQENLNAVTRLLLNGYIPESVAKEARRKIIRKVFKNMKKKVGE